MTWARLFPMRQEVIRMKKAKGLSYWSPTINLARDPRWGRAEEGYGEDTYLTAALAENYVNGMQERTIPI